MATWCQRDNSTTPFTPEEEKKLDFLYSEWTHPHFISINVSVRCYPLLQPTVCTYAFSLFSGDIFWLLAVVCFVVPPGE